MPLMRRTPKASGIHDRFAVLAAAGEAMAAIGGALPRAASQERAMFESGAQTERVRTEPLVSAQAS